MQQNDNLHLLTLLLQCSHKLQTTERNRGQGRLLVFLQTNGGTLTQRDLIRLTGRRSATLSEQLDHMERAGLVLRQKNAQDKRNIDVTLTPLGEEAAAQAQIERQRFADDLFVSLSEEKKQRLTQTLSDLLTDWDVPREESTPPAVSAPVVPLNQTGIPDAVPNQMGTQSIPKLIWKLAAPVTLSLFGQALYQLADIFFLSHMTDTTQISALGDKAIHALTLVLPISLLMLALGNGTSLGVHAMLTKHLQNQNHEQANRTMGNGILLSIFYTMVFFLFGCLAASPFFASQTTDSTVTAFGVTYLRILSLGSFGLFGSLLIEKLLLSANQSSTIFTSHLCGILLNLIFDPIFIYGWFGSPSLGVAGAALATVLGQIATLILLVFFYLRSSGGSILSKQYIVPSFSILKDIYMAALPAILIQLFPSILSCGMNGILGTISSSAVIVYGIYNRLQNLVFLPAYGLSYGISPILSYNLGANQTQRIRQTIKYGLVCVSILMAAGMFVLQVFAPQLVGLFTLAEPAHSVCVFALQIATWGFVFSGVNILFQSVCQSLGHGAASLLIVLLRLVVFVLPLGYLLSHTVGAHSIVWLVLPASEGITCLLAIVFTQRICQHHAIRF